jgi:hypothetical protein
MTLLIDDRRYSEHGDASFLGHVINTGGLPGSKRALSALYGHGIAESLSYLSGNGQQIFLSAYYQDA